MVNRDYSKPELIEYGELEELTNGGENGSGDGLAGS
jgi:hypothetical protein